MKTKILLIFIIILSTVLIGLGIYFNFSNEKENKAEDPIASYDLNELGVIKTCYSEDCENNVEDTYYKMSHKNTSAVLQNAIKKINTQIESDYKEATESNMTDSSCSALAGFNQHSIRYYHQYYSYTKDDIIFLAFKRDKINICNDNKQSYQFETYYYDTKQNKMLTQDEVLSKLGYSKEDIKSSITSYIDIIAKLEQETIQTKQDFSDAVVYCDTVGDLYVSFHAENLQEYRVASLIKQQKES